MARCLISTVAVSWLLGTAHAEGLVAARLAVIYKLDDSRSEDVARHYVARHHIPAGNLIGIRLPVVDVLAPEVFSPIRARVIEALPSSVQSLLLVWSKPFAVGCMSVTTAFAADYRPGFCEPGCAHTLANPLYDSEGWLPADTVDWFPAMLLPSDDEALADRLIDRGLGADGTSPSGTLYLVRTRDWKRNVRAETYPLVEAAVGMRIRSVEVSASDVRDASDAIGYFTGAKHVDELPRVHFRAGALADHLTSTGGLLEGGAQMSALEWLRQGATASYGSVSEPCALLGKFPDIRVLFEHYLHGETALESYWKSVQMPGQGLFIGDPLARPYGSSIQ